ncbi:unannotated protein [freshwater metagenome]|uniref:Unannotated protein n=1 Tax=freshwater metagenome TaxID=449393 RepID=A0A6J7A3X9_9ZZZZ
MDEALDRVVAAELADEFGISNVADDEWSVEQRLAGSGLERIKHDHLVSGGPQCPDRV